MIIFSSHKNVVRDYTKIKWPDGSVGEIEWSEPWNLHGGFHQVHPSLKAVIDCLVFIKYNDIK